MYAVCRLARLSTQLENIEIAPPAAPDPFTRFVYFYAAKMRSVVESPLFDVG